MFKFWGSGNQTAQSHPQNESSGSYYPPSAINSQNSSHPESNSSSSSLNSQKPANVSPAAAAGIINVLKEKSAEDLHKLLSDKDAYQQFLLSLDQVKIQNNIRDDLRKETMQLARDNQDKEPTIEELRNQCRIIRTSELASTQDKFNELEKQKEELLKMYSPASHLQRLQEAMNNIDEESETLIRKLLAKEIDLAAFVHKYKQLRIKYHKQVLILLAARTSIN